MSYTASSNRYDGRMQYRYCGKSGLQLPRICLGLWQNFGDISSQDEAEKMLKMAFDNGITHFDLANNYGYPAGSAERNFGKIFKNNFLPYRDELIISTKAGYGMWEGPYGDWGSRKYLMASLDQSLKRMGLEYVDIFYSHRYDPNTPIEETMQALVDIVHQGKALYAGISNYPAEAARKAFAYLKSQNLHCLIYQGKYNMMYREMETGGIFDAVQENGSGFITFSALAQGVLSDKYLNGIPQDSRAANPHSELKASSINEKLLLQISQLNELAAKRQQSLAQMALAWTLRNDVVTSSLVGVSTCKQLQSNLEAIKNTTFSSEEINKINSILA